jgi:hypothetical protein
MSRAVTPAMGHKSDEWNQGTVKPPMAPNRPEQMMLFPARGGRLGLLEWPDTTEGEVLESFQDCPTVAYMQLCAYITPVQRNRRGVNYINGALFQYAMGRKQLRD